MTTTVGASGTQACTLDTEHTLADVSVAGFHGLEIEIPSAATAADLFVFRKYTKLDDSGDTFYQSGPAITLRGSGAIRHESPFAPAQTAVATRFTVEQTDATGRTIGWAVYSS